MSVTYHYWRFRSRYHEEIDTLIHALERVKDDMEYERAHPEKIVLEDGTELSQEEVIERCGWYGNTGPIIDGSVVVKELPEENNTSTD